MAIWQFDCYLIHKNKMNYKYYSDFDEILSWGKRENILENIDFLEKQKSWSDKISCYGKNDETCVEFFYEDDILKEIYCRIDLRYLFKEFLEKFLRYIKNGWSNSL